MRKKGIRSEKYYYRREMNNKSARMIKAGWRVLNVQADKEHMGSCLFPLGYFLKKDVWIVTYEFER